MSSGDQINLPLPYQRLDKIDVADISRLGAENTVKQFGTLMGPVGGLASQVETSWDADAGELIVGPCRLFASHYAVGQTIKTDGAFIDFRPELLPGLGRVSLAPLGGDPGYVFFKRLETPMDEENRGYYDAVNKVKKVGLANTRLRETVELVAGSEFTSYSRNSGYFPLFRITSFPDGAPDVRPILAFAGFNWEYDVTRKLPLFTPGGDSPFPGININDTASIAAWRENQGLPLILQMMAYSLQAAYDNRYTIDWSTTPPTITYAVTDPVNWASPGLTRGLVQLGSDLDDVVNDVTHISAVVVDQLTDLNNIKARVIPLYSLEVATGNTKLHESSLGGTFPATSGSVGTGRWAIDFSTGGPPCSETNLPCVVQVTLRGPSTVGFIYYEWTSEYVLEIRRKDSSGTDMNFGFSLSILRSQG